MPSSSSGHRGLQPSELRGQCRELVVRVETARVRKDPDLGSLDVLRLRADRRPRPIEGDAKGADTEKRHHHGTEAADRPVHPARARAQLSGRQLVRARHLVDSFWMTAMDDAIVERIHGSGRRIALAITGGGSGVIARLLRVPGGSRTLVEAVVPYTADALVDFLGHAPEQACSVETAVAMA